MEDLKDFVRGTEDQDRQAVEAGSHVKYVLEYYDEEEDLIELLNFYSDKYFSKEEFMMSTVDDLAKPGLEFVVNGPYELYEGAFDNAKIERYKHEKSEVGRDESYIASQISLHKGKYKYLYTTYIRLYGIYRVYGITTSNYALKPYEVKKMLKNDFSDKVKVIRRNLDNSQSKVYE